jgi:hypothetical protein
MAYQISSNLTSENSNIVGLKCSEPIQGNLINNITDFSWSAPPTRTNIIVLIFCVTP